MKHPKLTFLLTLLISIVGTKAFAYDAKIGDIYYDFYGDNAEVTFRYENSSYNSDAYTGSIVIPQTIVYQGKTYYVTSIGVGAFRNCYNLSSVNIPNTITAIGNSAFLDCRGLSSMSLPNNLSYIGEMAFEGCSFNSISIPGSVKYIGSWAFAYNSNLSSVSVSDNVSYISPSVFSRTAWYNNQPDGLVYVG